MLNYTFFFLIIVESEMKVVKLNCESPDPEYCPTYPAIIKSLLGIDPHDCMFELVFEFDRERFRWSGRCRCNQQRNTRPRCKPCQNGASYRTDYEINLCIEDIKKKVQRRFDAMLEDVKDFFSTCKDFSIFLSPSSMVLLNLQGEIGPRKTKVLSSDLETNLENFMRKYQGNQLSRAGGKICLGDISQIIQHVRMPTSSGSICPNFADISIRGELLALSMSMKMLCRFASLCHLYYNRDRQMRLIRQIANYICRMYFFRRQIRK